MLLVTESLTLIAGNAEPALLVHLVEALDAGRRFLGDAADGGLAPRVELRILREPAPDRGEERGLLGVRRVRDARRIGLGPGTEMHEQRRVAAVVQDHVRAPLFGILAGPVEDPVRVIPVLVERLALVREDRRAAGGDRRGGVVLRRVDVARRPADLGAQRLQRLDQHRRLDRHVQRARDARAAQRLLGRELLADRHQAGHLRLGDRDLLAAPVGEREVGDAEVAEALHLIGSIHRSLLELGDRGRGKDALSSPRARARFNERGSGFGFPEPGSGPAGGVVVATLLGRMEFYPIWRGVCSERGRRRRIAK